MTHAGFKAPSPRPAAPAPGAKPASGAPAAQNNNQKKPGKPPQPNQPKKGMNPNIIGAFGFLRKAFVAAAVLGAGAFYVGNLHNRYEENNGKPDSTVNFVGFAVTTVLFDDIPDSIMFVVKKCGQFSTKTKDTAIYEKVTGSKEAPSSVIRDSIIVNIPRELINAGWNSPAAGSELAAAKDAALAQIRLVAIARAIEGGAHENRNMNLRIRPDLLELYRKTKGDNSVDLFSVLSSAPGTPIVLNDDTALRLSVSKDPRFIPF